MKVRHEKAPTIVQLEFPAIKAGEVYTWGTGQYHYLRTSNAAGSVCLQDGTYVSHVGETLWHLRKVDCELVISQ